MNAKEKQRKRAQLRREGFTESEIDELLEGDGETVAICEGGDMMSKATVRLATRAASKLNPKRRRRKRKAARPQRANERNDALTAVNRKNLGEPTYRVSRSAPKQRRSEPEHDQATDTQSAVNRRWLG